MSEEKQIEEMAKILSEDCGSCESCMALGSTSNGIDCTDYYYARNLYNAGYRKQSDVVRCKDCEHYYQVGDVRICRHWNYHSTKDDAYCSFAKMKGGAK